MSKLTVNLGAVAEAPARLLVRKPHKDEDRNKALKKAYRKLFKDHAFAQFVRLCY